MKSWVHNLARQRFASGDYSQGGQDGILAEIFQNIPTANNPPFCVEFGFDSDTLHGGNGSNTARLLIEKGWKGLLMDGSHANPAINLQKEFVTSKNIVALLRKWDVPDKPDYISIDIDSTDLWVFRALLPTYRAAVYSVEYNAHFPLHAAITFADDPKEAWDGDRGYGASLRALAEVASEYGYSLVAVEPMFDAFFVRNDLIDDGSQKLAPPLEHWQAMTSLSIHPILKNPKRTSVFLDYVVWRKSGDLEAARSAAAKMCRYYLLRVRRDGGWWQCLKVWVKNLRRLFFRSDTYLPLKS